MRFALFLFLASCARLPANLHTRPQEDEARAVVWCDIFHDRGTQPVVEWVEQADLNCWGGAGFYAQDYPGGPIDGTCVGGVYYVDQNFARVADWELPISQTYFTHELYHAHLQSTFGDPDSQHVGAGWQSGGEVDNARRALASAGL